MLSAYNGYNINDIRKLLSLYLPGPRNVLYTPLIELKFEPVIHFATMNIIFISLYLKKMTEYYFMLKSLKIEFRFVCCNHWS